VSCPRGSRPWPGGWRSRPPARPSSWGRRRCGPPAGPPCTACPAGAPSGPSTSPSPLSWPRRWPLSGSSREPLAGELLALLVDRAGQAGLVVGRVVLVDDALAGGAVVGARGLAEGGLGRVLGARGDAVAPAAV